MHVKKECQRVSPQIYPQIAAVTLTCGYEATITVLYLAFWIGTWRDLFVHVIGVNYCNEDPEKRADIQLCPCMHVYAILLWERKESAVLP